MYAPKQPVCCICNEVDLENEGSVEGNEEQVDVPLTQNGS